MANLGSYVRRGLAVSCWVLPGFTCLSAPVQATGFDDAHRIWTAQGAQPGAAFGQAVSSAGDVNGDGFPDLIVGAPRQDGAAGADCGAAFIFYGTASGLSTVPGWTAEGEQAGALFGWAVASAGDVNGDGFGDVVVGSPGYEVPEPDPSPIGRGAGRVYVYLGSEHGLSSTPILVADGMPYDLGERQGLGGTVTSGDFNGDGYGDVAAGQYATYFAGAMVFYGSADGPSLENQWQSASGVNLLGYSMAAADVNGDGYDDLFLTSFDPRFSHVPQAVGYLGSASGLPAVEGDSPPLVPPSFTFAAWTSVASAGDVDGDGLQDLLVAQGDPGNNESLGHALYRGSPGGPVLSAEPTPVLGVPSRLAPLGDVNGDGFPDAITQDGTNLSFYLGSASGYRPISDGMGTLAGTVAAAGDVNRDGFADIGVGDPTNERVDVFRGATDWTFAVTADLAVQVELVESADALLMVRNQGPDTVRFRTVDVFPQPLSGTTWFCYSGPGGGSTASCILGPDDSNLTGDIDSLVEMAPGAELHYFIQFPPLLLPVADTVSLALPDWVHDPDPSNNRATFTLGPLEEPIFADGFESGNLSAWSSRSARGLFVLRSAALEGSYGLFARTPLLGSAVVRNDSPESEHAYHARFRLDPRGFGGTPFLRRIERGAREAVLFSARGLGTSLAPFDILLRRSQGELSLVARAALDDGTLRTEAVPIAAAPQVIDVAWRRATAMGASDGLLLLQVDGAPGASLSGLDNDASSGIDSVEWGLAPLAGRPRIGAPAFVFLDSFASWRLQ
jgi:hypothetical protein